MTTPTPAPQSASAASHARVSIPDQLAALVGKRVFVQQYGAFTFNFTGELTKLPDDAGPLPGPFAVTVCDYGAGQASTSTACLLFRPISVTSIRPPLTSRDLVVITLNGKTAK